MPLLSYYNQTVDARRFFPSLNQGLRFVLLLSALFVCYWMIIRLINQGAWQPSIRAVFFVSIPLSLMALLLYPFNANDIYRYVIRGRITAVYGGNPFLEPPSAFPAERFNTLAGEWVDYTSPYGPLWEAVAPLPVLLTPDSPLGQLIGFKVLTVAAHLLVGLLLYTTWQKDLVDPQQALTRTAAWLWNPGLLLIFAADGHNDSLMILFLAAGWIVLQRGVVAQRWSIAAAAIILMWLSPMVKAIGLLPMPLFALYALKQFSDWSSRLKIILVSSLGIIALTFLLFLPFGSPLDLIARLVEEASAGASFTPVTLAMLLQAEHGSITFLLWERISLSGTLLGGVWVMWRVYRGRYPLQAAADFFLIYLLFAYNFRLWYTAWPFVFLLLDRQTTSARLFAGHLFLFAGQASVFIFSHLWYYSYDQETLASYQVGIPFVFILPPLVGWVWSRIIANY